MLTRADTKSRGFAHLLTRKGAVSQVTFLREKERRVLARKLTDPKTAVRTLHQKYKRQKMREKLTLRTKTNNMIHF